MNQIKLIFFLLLFSNSLFANQDKHSYSEIDRITVTASPFATKVLDSAAAIKILDGQEKSLKQTLSLGDSLASYSGVSSISTGSQSGKPVIRGLSGNRIKILWNSVAQDFLQFGVRHPPGLTPVLAQRIELVKGPMSVLYGADAIGGVVNLISSDIPIGADNIISDANLGLSYQTNNSQKDYNLSLSGGSNRWGWNAALTESAADNFKTPNTQSYYDSQTLNAPKFTGEIPFTDFNIKNADVAIGYSAHHLDADFRINIWNNDQNFLQPNGLPTGQKLRNENFAANLNYEFLSEWSANIKLSLQKNERDAVTGASYQQLTEYNKDLAISLERKQATISLNHPQVHGWKGQFGTELVSKNQNTSIGTLVPDADYNSKAIFLYEVLDSDLYIAEFGARYDSIKQQAINKEQAWVNDFTEHQWQALSGSIGITWKLDNQWLLMNRVARGFRAPSIFDLYANGVHGGVAAYQIGNPELKEEYSLNKEIGLTYLGNKLGSTITYFHNKIDDYIYQANSLSFDHNSSLPIYVQKQNNATIDGVEAELNWKINEKTSVEANYTWINSELAQTTEELPMMPADSGYIAVNYLFDNTKLTKNLQLNANYSFYADKQSAGAYEPFSQYDDLPFGTASTKSYGLFGISASADSLLLDKPFFIQLKIDNLFDKSYRNFLDTYKGYTLGMGRNVRLSVSIPLI